MSTAIVYFGLLPKDRQRVSEELSRKGINLLKSSPSALRITMSVNQIQPLYSVYKDSYQMFLKSAIEGVSVSTGSDTFYPSPHLTFPPSPLSPVGNIIAHPNTKLSVETMNDLKTKFVAEEVKIGKDFCIVFPNFSGAPSELAQYKLNRFTRTIDNTMNLAAYGCSRALARMADSFLRLHQYPAVKEDDGLPSAAEMELDGWKAPEDVPMAEGEAPRPVVVPTIKHIRTKVNLVQPFTTYDYAIRSTSDIPQGYNYLFFAYLRDLAIEDKETVPAVIERYFLHTLGSNSEECIEALEEVKSSWGVLRTTDWGKMITHLYKGIEIAMETQSVVRPFIQGAAYHGFILIGGGYTISVSNKIFRPQPYEHIVESINKHLPFSAAWEKVKKILKEYKAVEDANVVDNLESTADVDALIRSDDDFNLSMQDRKEILEEIRKTALPGDRFLPPTISNVIKCLKGIKLGLPMGPLHPIALLSDDVVLRGLSMFGNTAPSFLVPGGRKMPLSKPFESVIKQKGKETISKNVNKVASVLVPLDTAVADLKTVLKEGYILNPFANNITRASTSAIVKTYDGDGCLDILASLRELAGVSLSDDPRNKRSRDDDVEAGSSKRSRMFDD